MTQVAAVPGEKDHLATVLGLMGAGEQFSAKVRKWLSVYVVGLSAWALGRRLWTRGVSEVTYQVTVESNDDIYADVQSWLLDQMPARRQRALVARSGNSGGQPQVAAPDGVEEKRTLLLSYDGRRVQTVVLDGHRVRVTVEQEDVSSRDPTSGNWRWQLHRVVFAVSGVAARDAVIDQLRQMAEARSARRQPRVLVCTSWSEWIRTGDQPLRSLDSVVLRAGQREEIVGDLERFLAAEDTYARLGLPWHRGYLLKGPPGTGKTSLAKALALHFNFNVYFMPLATLPNDGAFLRVLAAVPARSLLLIEDIDIAHGARKRDDGEPGVTLSGLLNGLDGVLTPHGLITVMTSNDESVIDPALLRPGRADQQYELDFLDDDQLARLVAFALGRPIPTLARVGDRQVTPAMVVEALKPHLERPAGAAKAIRDLIASSVGVRADELRQRSPGA